jgi:hypothetical protein
MRALFVSLSLLVVFSAFGAETAAESPLAQQSALEPLLPLKIPGYELRVLDLAKPVVLMVGGTRLETFLPVFFYMPDSDQRHAITLIQQAYAELSSLGRKGEWSGEELHRVLLQLEQALQTFRTTFAPASLKSPAEPGRK